MKYSLLPSGDSAYLIDFGLDNTDMVWCESLNSIDGVSDVVPGANTILVRFNPLVVTSIESSIDNCLISASKQTNTNTQIVEIPVIYNGEDLDSVAKLTGLDITKVIELHSNSLYTVSFLGFSPGFAYLKGLNPLLYCPRLSIPRTSVPKGAVAIADRYSAIYPTSSPGGWNLIGVTKKEVFDNNGPLLTPGTTVRFVA